MEAAEAIITLARWWLYAGAVIAAVFLAFGIDRIDENARGSYTFRPLLVPGVMLLWPLVLWRWGMIEAGRVHWSQHHKPLRGAHGPVWMLIAVIIAVVFCGALALKQNWSGLSLSADLAPRQLTKPVR